MNQSDPQPAIESAMSRRYASSERTIQRPIRADMADLTSDYFAGDREDPSTDSGRREHRSKKASVRPASQRIV